MNSFVVVGALLMALSIVPFIAAGKIIRSQGWESENGDACAAYIAASVILVAGASYLSAGIWGVR